MGSIEKPFQYFSDEEEELDYASKTAYLFIIKASCSDNIQQIMINDVPIYVG